MKYFYEFNALIIGLAFFVLLLLGWVAGARAGLNRKPEAADGKAGSTRVEDACIALFVFVLAFFFAQAPINFQHRKVDVRNQAIAIADFATTSSALKEPERGAIRQELRIYVRQQLQFGVMQLSDPRMESVIAETRATQDRIWAHVERAIDTGNTPAVQTPLINGFNGMTAAYDKRLYGIRDRVPFTILLTLAFLGIFTAFTIGRLRDRQEKIRISFVKALVYTALVALVFTVAVELEQPRRGLNLVSQRPMQDILKSLTPPGGAAQ